MNTIRYTLLSTKMYRNFKNLPGTVKGHDHPVARIYPHAGYLRLTRAYLYTRWHPSLQAVWLLSFCDRYDGRLRRRVRLHSTASLGQYMERNTSILSNAHMNVKRVSSFFWHCAEKIIYRYYLNGIETV